MGATNETMSSPNKRILEKHSLVQEMEKGLVVCSAFDGGNLIVRSEHLRPYALQRLSRQ